VNAQSLDWLTGVSLCGIGNKENKPYCFVLPIKMLQILLFSQVLNTLDFALWSRIML
jgi:hypothetical protein